MLRLIFFVPYVHKSLSVHKFAVTVTQAENSDMSIHSITFVQHTTLLSTHIVIGEGFKDDVIKVVIFPQRKIRWKS